MKILYLLEEMMSMQLRPSVMTYSALISACQKADCLIAKVDGPG